MKPSKRLHTPEQRELAEKLAGMEPFRDPYDLTHGVRCPACHEPTARPKNICINEYCTRFGERADDTFWTPKHLLEGIGALGIMLVALSLPWFATVLWIMLVIGGVVAVLK